MKFIISLFIILIFLLVSSSCTVVTAPLGLARTIASTTVRTTGKIANTTVSLITPDKETENKAE